MSVRYPRPEEPARGADPSLGSQPTIVGRKMADFGGIVGEHHLSYCVPIYFRIMFGTSYLGVRTVKYRGKLMKRALEQETRRIHYSSFTYFLSHTSELPVTPISLTRKEMQSSICQGHIARTQQLHHLNPELPKAKEYVFHTTLHCLSSHKCKLRSPEY